MPDTSRRGASSHQQPLSEMTSNYFDQHRFELERGLATESSAGEVHPFEAAPVQPVDPRIAWDEARTAAMMLGPKNQLFDWKVPVDWPTLIRGHEPVVALAFAIGNFPQLVRDYHQLLQMNDLKLSRQTGGSRQDLPSIKEEAAAAIIEKRFPQSFVAIATLRLAKQFDFAAELGRQLRDEVPAEWEQVRINEEAALAWHRGDAEQAMNLWHLQPESAPVLFNRGMSSLFMNRRAIARTLLLKAISQIPDESAWHHLAKLYLTLAEMR